MIRPCAAAHHAELCNVNNFSGSNLCLTPLDRQVLFNTEFTKHLPAMFSKTYQNSPSGLFHNHLCISGEGRTASISLEGRTASTSPARKGTAAKVIPDPRNKLSFLSCQVVVPYIAAICSRVFPWTLTPMHGLALPAQASLVDLKLKESARQPKLISWWTRVPARTSTGACGACTRGLGRCNSIVDASSASEVHAGHFALAQHMECMPQHVVIHMLQVWNFLMAERTHR
jgi:hypothetical protein